ncbi:unnamed protein product, partial [Musa hybrid cultivar]
LSLRLLSRWETETELGVGGLAGGEASITDDLSLIHSPTHPLFLLLEELEWRAHEQPKQANLSSYEATEMTAQLPSLIPLTLDNLAKYGTTEEEEMFGDSLYSCFSGHRRPSHSAPLPISLDARAATATTCCSSSSSCASSVAFKNFNSLYDPGSDTETLALTLSSPAAAAAGSSFSSSCDAPDDADAGGSCPSERDLSTAIASRRLLPASPGLSNSIVDSAAVTVGVGAGVAVPTYSPDPYWDFRRSMEEMVAALGLDAGAHRAHLHDLLLCYLALNRKHAHKYIISAFADLLLTLASAKGAPGDA